jgi:chemotaxis signal transduction protein
MKKTDNSNLLEAGDAVEDYLGSLLQEATEKPSEQRPVALRDNIVLLADFDIDADAEMAEDEPVTQAVEETPAQAVEQKAVDTTTDSVPDYDFPIQCLMFKVRDVALSIPLNDLSGVVPWPQELTQIPSASDWSLGVLVHRERTIKVVDSARLLDIKQDDVPTDSPQHGHILIIADSDWSFSCDTLGKVVTLEQDNVQWHSDRAGGFSHGTIRDSLAQLLSTRKIVEHLQQQTVE